MCPRLQLSAPQEEVTEPGEEDKKAECFAFVYHGGVGEVTLRASERVITAGCAGLLHWKGVVYFF